MGLFKKKGKNEEEEIPKLPELPQLPDLPDFSESEKKDFDLNKIPEEEPLPQLPSFPNGSLGNKFSQDTIKEAITGRKEEEVEADESAEKLPTMQRPLVREETKEMRKENYFPQKMRTKEAEPIFIRIDRFEEGSQTFEEVRTKIAEIEEMFNEVKKIKEKEEQELLSWEDEIKQIKAKIENIDNNIFSQIK